MSEFVHFQVDEQKALEMKVVKHQIDKKVAIVSANALLSFDESKTLSQFKKELLQICNNTLL